MHARAVQRNTTLKAERDEAQAEIRQLKAERFGKQSEKRSAVDRSNRLNDPDDQATPKNKRGQQPGRPAPKRRDYSHLPEREELIDLPEDAKICDCCGNPLADLGHRDDSEQIEIETTVYRRVIRRKRFRRTCDCDRRQRTVTAPPPPKLLPKSIYGTSLWTHLLLEKFHLQRPTNRIIEQLRLLGLSLAPGTITDGLKRIEPQSRRASITLPRQRARRVDGGSLQRLQSHAASQEWQTCVGILLGSSAPRLCASRERLPRSDGVGSWVAEANSRVIWSSSRATDPQPGRWSQELLCA